MCLGDSLPPCHKWKMMSLQALWKLCRGFSFFLSGFCFFSLEFPFAVPPRTFILQWSEDALEILDITGIYLWNNCAGVACIRRRQMYFFLFFFYRRLLKRNKTTKLNFSACSGWVARDTHCLAETALFSRTKQCTCRLWMNGTCVRLIHNAVHYKCIACPNAFPPTTPPPHYLISWL